MHCASWVPLSFLQHCLHTCILSTNLLVRSSVRADGMIFKLRTSLLCALWLVPSVSFYYYFSVFPHFPGSPRGTLAMGCLCVVEQTKLLLRARAVCSFLERLSAADFSPVFFVVVASTAPPSLNACADNSRAAILARFCNGRLLRLPIARAALF